MKVLVPLDGSDASRNAMLGGLTLLKGTNPEVTLLCVKAEGFETLDDDRLEMFEEDEDDEIFVSDKEADAMLEVAVQECSDVGATAITKIATGNFAKIILEESANYDLLLMHALGTESVREKLRMSKTEMLARNAACPVLLV